MVAQHKTEEINSIAFLIFINFLALLLLLSIIIVGYWGIVLIDAVIHNPKGPWPTGILIFLLLPGGTLLILFLSVLIGLMLRRSFWLRRYQASLCLASVGSIAILLCYFFFCLLGNLWGERFVSTVIMVAAFSIGPLPPFLHWWKSS
jgi:hypothetical protein